VDRVQAILGKRKETSSNTNEKQKTAEDQGSRGCKFSQQYYKIEIKEN
jgi:hypothetical protein